jgi:hypothetical protein
MNTCDFCSSPEVVARLKVAVFELVEYRYRSTEDFWTCKDCLALVAARDHKALLARSIETFDPPEGVAFSSLEIEKVTGPMRVLQEAFFANWDGEAHAVTDLVDDQKGKN